MSLSRNLSPSPTKTVLDFVFFSKFDYPTLPGIGTSRDSDIFMPESTKLSAVTSEQYEGPGYFEERDEEANVPSASPRIKNQKTTNILNFSKSVDITKNYFDDEQFSTVKKLVSDFGRLARLSQDRNAFKVFNNGFGTQLTNDGLSFFNASHTIATGTADNADTAALSESALNTAFNALITQPTQDGSLGGHQPSTLLVPPALFKTAMEITKSELRSGTTDNDMNYYSSVYPGLKVKYSPFLDASYGGSDTAWFLLSDNHSVMRYKRQDIVTDLVDYKYQRNNNYIYKAEYREEVDTVSFEGAYGSTGAA